MTRTLWTASTIALMLLMAVGPANAAWGETNTERLLLVTVGHDGSRQQSARRATNRLMSSAPSIPESGVRMAIRTYQLLLSSQDKPSCQFVPSCSHYCLGAISRHGLLLGALKCSDRVMRCHPGARHQYPIDPTTGRAIDPPDPRSPEHEGNR